MYQHANASIWGKIQRIFIAILHEETADVKSLESGQYFPDAKVKKKRNSCKVTDCCIWGRERKLTFCIMNSF